MLTVSLLGTPDFVLDRTSLTTLPKRTKALVCLLAETPGERYGRDRLVDLLWPDVDETTGRHRLRSCLLALRNALKPHQADTLVAEGDGLHLASEAVEVDTSQLEQFSTSQDAGALAIAAALYRGEFLDGFPFVSEGFDDWARRRRAHYAMLASDMLTRLTRLQSEAGDHSAATATATKLIGLDPLSEDAHRMLIGVHIRAGRHSNALKQYRECARILEDELDVAPSPETRALIDQLRKMTDSDSQPASAAEHRKPVVFVAPLEGRTDAERDLAANLGDELRAHFARLTGMIVALSGKAAEYRVEGGVRLGQGRSRVYARLVETDEGRQIWSDRYDEKTDEPFDILDLCAPRIASGVRRRVLADDADRTRDRMPDELTLEELLAAAGAHFYKPTKSGWRGGGELAEIALKRAPEDSMALAMAAAGLGLLNYLYDFREPASDVIDLAFERVRLALQQTSRSDMLHVTHSLLLLFSRRRYREALTAAQRALEINPNYNMGYWALGAVEAFSGDHEAAVASARRAVDVDSRDPYLHLYSRIVAYGYLGAGDHDEATDWFHKADQLAPSVVPNLIGVTVALWCAGDKLGAADALAQLTSQEPQFRVSAMVDLPYSDPIMPKLFRDCLAAAGAPR